MEKEASHERMENNSLHKAPNLEGLALWWEDESSPSYRTDFWASIGQCHHIVMRGLSHRYSVAVPRKKVDLIRIDSLKGVVPAFIRFWRIERTVVRRFSRPVLLYNSQNNADYGPQTTANTIMRTSSGLLLSADLWSAPISDVATTGSQAASVASRDAKMLVHTLPNNSECVIRFNYTRKMFFGAVVSEAAQVANLYDTFIACTVPIDGARAVRLKRNRTNVFRRRGVWSGIGGQPRPDGTHKHTLQRRPMSSA